MLCENRCCHRLLYPEEGRGSHVCICILNKNSSIPRPCRSAASQSHETLTLPPSPLCHCGLCGDVLAACRLKSPSSSYDPSFQKTTSNWIVIQAGHELNRISIGISSANSRRMTEEELHEYWKSIDLSEPGPPVSCLFLPKWIRDDVILLKIAGLCRPLGETDSQRVDRLRRECDERERLHPWIASPSSSVFTDSEDESSYDPSADFLEERPKDTNPPSSSFRLQEPTSHSSLPDFSLKRAERRKKELGALDELGISQENRSNSVDSFRSSFSSQVNFTKSNIVDSFTTSHGGFFFQVTQTSFSKFIDLDQQTTLSFVPTHIFTINELAFKPEGHIRSLRSRSIDSLLSENSRRSLIQSTDDIRVIESETEKDTTNQDHHSGIFNTSLDYIDMAVETSRKSKQNRSSFADNFCSQSARPIKRVQRAAS